MIMKIEEKCRRAKKKKHHRKERNQSPLLKLASLCAQVSSLTVFHQLALFNCLTDSLVTSTPFISLSTGLSETHAWATGVPEWWTGADLSAHRHRLMTV